MHNIEIPHKNKLLSLFHINGCSLNKVFHDLRHLLSCNKKTFDIIAISETTIIKILSLLDNLNLNNYSNHLSYKCCNDLNIYKKNELESTFIEIVNPQKTNIIVGVIYRIHLWTLPTLIAVT